MKNQKAPNEARSTTAIGTTIAGMSVERLDEAFAAAALLVAGAEAFEAVVSKVDEAESASADVREAYSAELVIVLILSVVMVVLMPWPVTL